MTNWLEKTKRPVLPIYLAALVWLVVGLFAPRLLLRLGTLLATAALAFLSSFFPIPYP